MRVVPLPSGLDAREAALRLRDLPGLCVLDGDAAHREGRFSFVAVEPVQRVCSLWPEREPLAALGVIEREIIEAGGQDDAHDIVSGLRACELPRWIGYVAYDACLTQSATRHVRPPGRPVLDFARYDALLVFDLLESRGFVVGDDEAACARMLTRVQRGPQPLASSLIGELHASPGAEHVHAIERALEHIARGDVYEINLAREFTASYAGEPLALWRALQVASPVPLGFYFDAGTRVIAARTMERFLRWQRGERTLRTRPIKGTLARGTQPDAALADVLSRDEKERAEHVMIVDLMRNDLSRVAELGSVHVPERLAIEPYAHLLHMVSTVECRTREGVSLRDVLEATFPPGSITGAPKLAAITHIEALEAAPRDVYTGAVGFIDRSGGCSLAVAIRTAVLEQGTLRYFAGGGIVEASDPARELAETDLKARVLIDAARTLAPHSDLGTPSELR